MLSMSAAPGARQSDSHPTHPPCTPPARYDAWITKAWDTPSLFPLIIMSINNIYPGETGDLKPTAQEAARAKLRPVVDLSRWVLEARVNRRPGFVEQRMIITEDILAFGESPDFDDVIAPEDIARCGDVSELANASTSLLWNQGGTLPTHLFPL